MELKEALKLSEDTGIFYGFQSEKNVKYEETVENGRFKITLSSTLDKWKAVTCEQSDTDGERGRNKLRVYFINMLFQAAIYGVTWQEPENNKESL